MSSSSSMTNLDDDSIKSLQIPGFLSIELIKTGNGANDKIMGIFWAHSIYNYQNYEESIKSGYIMMNILSDEEREKLYNARSYEEFQMIASIFQKNSYDYEYFTNYWSKNIPFFKKLQDTKQVKIFSSNNDFVDEICNVINYCNDIYSKLVLLFKSTVDYHMFFYLFNRFGTVDVEKIIGGTLITSAYITTAFGLIPNVHDIPLDIMKLLSDHSDKQIKKYLNSNPYASTKIEKSVIYKHINILALMKIHEKKIRIENFKLLKSILSQ